MRLEISLLDFFRETNGKCGKYMVDLTQVVWNEKVLVPIGLNITANKIFVHPTSPSCIILQGEDVEVGISNISRIIKQDENQSYEIFFGLLVWKNSHVEEVERSVIIVGIS